MKELKRNQLVWLDPQAWAQIQAHAWDDEAQTILVHWQRKHLPLVVCRQRVDVEPDHVCLGLPAPLQWSRRRLALAARLDQIITKGSFPTLLQVAQANAWGPATLALDLALTQLGVTAQVYGSHGWQWLTHMPYLHEASDLDVTLNVPDFETACRVATLLAATELVPRLDGEIVFPGGQAVAWRELQRLLAGHTAQVLLKDRHAIRLASLEEVKNLGDVIASPSSGSGPAEARQSMTSSYMDCHGVAHLSINTVFGLVVGSTSVHHGGLKPALKAPWQTEVCPTNSEIG
ncbi:MAG: malonate decarboxylase holo-[acyl-carrier-protein] synthase [Betaproteobacteria bacterium HGW-Betaproteobacteria-18]|nr:MAG: malonate decarboxylase holo-[acyl-carrier-protein] synthase [Betaproteobacteria bacterium HGW-Betaproteobacteria-18]